MAISDETRSKWKEKIKTIVEAENFGCITLNDWEHGFIDSLYLQIGSGKDLSMKQSLALSKIYERVE